MKRMLTGGVVYVGIALLGALTAAAPCSAAAEALTTIGAVTTTPATGPEPNKPKPVNATIRLYLPDAFFVSRQPVTLPKRVLHVGGVVRPFIPGQWVRIRAFLGRRLIKSDALRIKRSRNGTYGRFTEALSSPGVGDVTVYVRHAGTTALAGFLAKRRFAVLDESIGFGSAGRFVELIQQRLAALHFYIPQTGTYDQGTGLAIDAYHRLLRWGTYQTLDGPTISRILDGVGRFRVRYRDHGKHAEGNLSDQLLALINGSHVYRIYPISSGKPSTPTVLGDFYVYAKEPGYLPDGMYDSNFFTGGYAIHGYDPAPDYPASHGCMRLPIVDAVSVYNWLDIGDSVDVYY